MCFIRTSSCRLAAALLLGGSLTLLVGCPNGAGNGNGDGGTAGGGATPTAPTGGGASTGGGGAVAGTPRLTFDRTVVSLGRITDTRTYSGKYTFQNTGDGELRISTVKAGCGCTVPTLSSYVFAPGQRGEISFEFDPKAMKDNTTKQITVISNANNEPANTVNLQFTASIDPLLRMDSRFLQLGALTVNQEHRATMNGTYNDPELEVLEITINQPYITAEVVSFGEVVGTDSTGQPEYKATFQLTIHEDAPWGTLYATRMFVRVKGRVDTNSDPIEHEYQTFVQGSLFGKLTATSSSRGRQATPTSVMSLQMLTPNEAFERSVEIRHVRGEMFEISSAEITESTLAGCQVRIEGRAPGEYSVVLYGNTGSFRGDIRGTVIVKTNVPGEETLPLKFAGLVR